MSYRIRRIDPFWMPRPAVWAAVGIGLLVSVAGFMKGVNALAMIGGVVLAGGVLVATKPAISAVMASLGIMGGIVTFVIRPDPTLVGLSVGWRLVSALFFSMLYMVLMDALILVVCALYNFFGGAMNLGGLHLDIEDTGESES